MWDSWFYRHDGQIHIFYLQARPPDDPAKKHEDRVSIGHAVTDDFVHYTELPTALEPGDGSAWDSLALWTGSVIEIGGKYYMVYTGRKNRESERWIQRIGLAISDDLINWTKWKYNPVLEARGRYDMNNGTNALGKIGAWRDPFVFRDGKSGNYYMTISARLKGRETEYNACVAIAQMGMMPDLWDVMHPIFSPGIYDEIECTQIIQYRGYNYLFFSTRATNYKLSFAKKRGSHSGLHCYYSNKLLKGYKPVNGNGVVCDNGEKMYDIRLIEDRDNEFVAVGWLRTQEGKYSGKLSMPFKLKIDGDRVYEI